MKLTGITIFLFLFARAIYSAPAVASDLERSRRELSVEEVEQRLEDIERRVDDVRSNIEPKKSDEEHEKKDEDENATYKPMRVEKVTEALEKILKDFIEEHGVKTSQGVKLIARIIDLLGQALRLPAEEKLDVERKLMTEIAGVIREKDDFIEELTAEIKSDIKRFSLKGEDIRLFVRLKVVEEALLRHLSKQEKDKIIKRIIQNIKHEEDVAIPIPYEIEVIEAKVEEMAEEKQLTTEETHVLEAVLIGALEFHSSVKAVDTEKFHSTPRAISPTHVVSEHAEAKEEIKEPVEKITPTAILYKTQPIDKEEGEEVISPTTPPSSVPDTASVEKLEGKDTESVAKEQQEKNEEKDLEGEIDVKPLKPGVQDEAKTSPPKEPAMTLPAEVQTTKETLPTKSSEKVKVTVEKITVQKVEEQEKPTVEVKIVKVNAEKTTQESELGEEGGAQTSEVSVTVEELTQANTKTSEMAEEGELETDSNTKRKNEELHGVGVRPEYEGVTSDESEDNARKYLKAASDVEKEEKENDLEGNRKDKEANHKEEVEIKVEKVTAKKPSKAAVDLEPLNAAEDKQNEEEEGDLEWAGKEMESRPSHDKAVKVKVEVAPPVKTTAEPATMSVPKEIPASKRPENIKITVEKVPHVAEEGSSKQKVEVKVHKIVPTKTTVKPVEVRVEISQEKTKGRETPDEEEDLQTQKITDAQDESLWSEEMLTQMDDSSSPENMAKLQILDLEHGQEKKKTAEETLVKVDKEKLAMELEAALEKERQHQAEFSSQPATHTTSPEPVTGKPETTTPEENQLEVRVHTADKDLEEELEMEKEKPYPDQEQSKHGETDVEHQLNALAKVAEEGDREETEQSGPVKVTVLSVKKVNKIPVETTDDKTGKALTDDETDKEETKLEDMEDSDLKERNEQSSRPVMVTVQKITTEGSVKPDATENTPTPAKNSATEEGDNDLKTEEEELEEELEGIKKADGRKTDRVRKGATRENLDAELEELLSM